MVAAVGQAVLERQAGEAEVEGSHRGAELRAASQSA